MFKNVAAKFRVFAFDATTNVPKTGDAANLTAYVSKDYGAVTVLADTSATEEDATNAPGYYLFDAAQGETNGDVLMVSGKSSTANVKVIGAPAVIYTRPTTGWLAPATAGRTLVVDANGLVDANAVKVGPTGSGTAQTARDLGGQLDAAVTTRAAASALATAQADLDTLTGTDGVTLATAQALYAPAKAGDAMALTSGERTTLAAAIWNALTSGMSTVGSIGKKLADWTIHSAADVWAVATRVLTAATNITSTGGTTVPQTGDSFARIGANGAGLTDLATAAALAAVAADLPHRYTRAVAVTGFTFFMRDSTTHAAATGLTVTAQRSIDGGALGACANAVSEIGNGLYKITLATTDMDGVTIALRFTATGADDLVIILPTQPT